MSTPTGSVQLLFEDGTSTPFLVAGQTRTHSVQVEGWAGNREGDRETHFIATPDHSATLAQMLLSHQSADFCVVGGKVCFIRHVITSCTDKAEDEFEH